MSEEQKHEVTEQKWTFPDDFKFPMEISAVEVRKAITPTFHKPGTPVAIRPCGDAKTYFGIYVGDIPINDTIVALQEPSKKLHVLLQTNPAIFVPDLGKIVYGYESWWGNIESEAHMKQITDDTIQQQWYVRAMKAMAERKQDEKEPVGQ